MRKSSVVKCCFISCTIAGNFEGWLRRLGVREGRAVGCWRTGVPGTRVGSLREEWNDDQGVPLAGEPGILEEEASSSSAIRKGRKGKGSLPLLLKRGVV